MAVIRIVDDWLRSPASPPSHYRSVMVIAEKWAEQRVLMRAYAESRDQLLPTIVLHGTELAIGPAGLDSNGSWGVHVGEPAAERAPQIKEHLESAARSLAGSKGNPPRLIDEATQRERGASWAAGDGVGSAARPAYAAPPPAYAPHPGHAAPHAAYAPGPGYGPAPAGMQPPVDRIAPMAAARIPPAPAAAAVAAAHAIAHGPPPTAVAAPSNPEQRIAPVLRGRRPTRPGIARTALGYQSGAGAQSAVVRLGLAPQVSARLGRIVDRVVPVDFHLEPRERRALNAIGEGARTARALGELVEAADGVSFMEELTRKLERYGLDLIEPGEPAGGEPTYRLRR
jgi:hypothetical protein